MANLSDKNSIPSEILDDLSSRFIVNIPEEERREPIRLCFQVELAYWFYLDFFCTEDPNLKACGMKEFTAQIFEHIPFLTPLLKNLDKVIDDWQMYKSSVPTYGAIVLNEDLTKVLLVQSYFTKSSWGFPKGKVNELEAPFNCAVREVLEETGLDISKMINENDYIEANVNEQTIRLYVVSGVNESIKFRPRTRNEIKKVAWFSISDLPSSRKDMTSKVKIGVGPNSFFMVLPFIKCYPSMMEDEDIEWDVPICPIQFLIVPTLVQCSFKKDREPKMLRRIRNWIQEKKQDKISNRHWNGRRHRHKSMGETPTNSSPLQPVSTASKSKSPNQALQQLENDLMQFSIVKNPVIQKNARNAKQQTKPNFKRQLFSDDEKNKDVQSQLPNEVNDLNGPNEHNKSKKKFPNQETQFIVPRWLNFKLDKVSILKCFDD